MEILIDSSAFFALNDKTDPRGDGIQSLLLEEGFSFVTTNFILAETLSLVTKRIGKHKGIEIGEKLFSSQVPHIVFLDETIQREAWALYKKYKDKDFDFIDATSFVVCRQRGIKEVITLDRHFAQMGFKVHP